MILCLPIIAYYTPLLLSGNKISAGDPDYYMALYEGFRRSVLEFHQFPWWDPWIAGGVPLFGNIQFGLISIPTPFVLLFGTVIGIKFSMLIYGIIGFFGARRLMGRYFKTPAVRTIALAYVFIFCGFFASRARMGHITFPLAVMTPWILYYYFYMNEKGAWWKFALWVSLLILSSPHYIAIMVIYFVGILFVADNVRTFVSLKKRTLKALWVAQRDWIVRLAKASGLILILCAYRMWFVLDFYRDHKRALSIDSEKFTGFKNAFDALWWQTDYTHYAAPAGKGLHWGWGEIATYIGFTTFIALCLVAIAWIVFYRKKFRTQFSRSIIALAVIGFTFLMLGMGNFSRFAPYHIAQHLPLFDAMRVATRWIFWFACIIILILASYKGKRFSKSITILCVIAAAELLIRYPSFIPQPYFIQTTQYRSASAPFYEERYNHVPRPQYADNAYFKQYYWFDENLFESTKNNVGQVLASDSLLYEAGLGQTIRCGVGADNRIPCPFIRSKNAKVTYWSPNKITLERTAPGEIELDMNPGRGWQINGTYPFAKGKSVTPMERFVFGDSKVKSYTISYAPKLSPSWVIWKIEKTL